MIDQVLITIANLSLDIWAITGMLAVGLSLTFQDVVGPLRNIRRDFLLLLASFILVPLLALGLTLIIPLGDPQSTALILLGACAGGPFIPQLVRMAKGNVPSSASSMSLLLLVTIFYLPLALPLLLYYVQVDVFTIARDLILFFLLPFVIGLLLKWRYAELSLGWRATFRQASRFSFLLLIVAGILPLLPRTIQAIGTWLILGAVVFTLGSALIGYILFFRQESGERKVGVLGTGQRNLGAALIVAAGSFDTDTFVMTVVASVVMTVVMHLVAAEWGRRTVIPSDETPSADLNAGS